MIITLKSATFTHKLNLNVWLVNSSLVGVDSSNTASSVTKGGSYTTTFTIRDGFKIDSNSTVSVVCNGQTYPLSWSSTEAGGTATLTISNVTAPITITVKASTVSGSTGGEDLPADLYTITWEVGGVNVATGSTDNGDSAIAGRRRSTDFIPVEYGYATLANGATAEIHVIYYDADKNYLAPKGYDTNTSVIYQTYTLSQVCTNIHAYKPDNAVYMRIVSRTADTAQDALWKPLSTAYTDYFDPNSVTWEAGGIGVANGVNTAAGDTTENTRRRTVGSIPVKYKNATLSGTVDVHIVFYDSTMTYLGTTMTNGNYSFYTISSGETKNLCEQAPENTAYYRILSRTADTAQDAYWSFSQ